VNIKIHAEGNVLVCGVAAFLPAEECKEYNVKKIPTEIANLLSEHNQHATTRVELGATVKDIMYSDSSLIEQVYKGIKVSQKISLIQNLKKIISNELKKEEAQHKEIMMCILPVVALELGANVTLKFDDIEELKEHPMMQTFLVNFGQLIESAIGQETDDILADRCDLSTYTEEQKQDDETKLEIKAMEMVHDGLDMANDLDDTVEFKAAWPQLAMVEGSVKSQGLGKAVGLGLMMGLYNTVLKPTYESRMREQEFE